MNKKTVLFIINIVCILSNVYGMDGPVITKNGEETVTIAVQDNQTKVPRLNLSSYGDRSSPSKPPKTGNRLTIATPKMPISSGVDLKQHVERARSIHRQTSMQSQKRPLFKENQDDVPVSINIADGDQLNSVAIDMPIGSNPSLSKKSRFILPKKRDALLSKRVAQELVGIELLDDAKNYSEEEVWDMLQHFNPALYNFGQQHKMDLDQVREYSVLFQGVDVTPQALVEFIKTHSAVNDQVNKNSPSYIQSLFDLITPANSSDDTLVKQYGKIRKENPDKYGSLILELIKGVCDQADGQQNTSMIANTHIGLQDSQITDQNTQIRQQWVVMIINALISLGGYAWGVYGQSSGSHHNCTA